MSRGFIAALLFISLFWMFLLLAQFRSSTFTLLLDDPQREEIHTFETVSALSGPEETRLIDVDRRWSPGQIGDTVDIRWEGLAKGSKSSMTGGYQWIQRRGSQELGRGSRFWIFFRLLFTVAAFGPALLFGILLCLRDGRESPKGAGEAPSIPLRGEDPKSR